MKYNVISEQSVDDLIKRVNNYLKQGWTCQGDVATIVLGVNYKVYYQAMVK